VTYSWSHSYERPTQDEEKWKWSHSNGWPTQAVSFSWVTYASDLILFIDLGPSKPSWIPLRFFLIKFFFTYYAMIWLDDLHASLPGLKHRSLFVFVISLVWWGLHLFEMCSLNRLTTSLLEFSLHRSCSELFAVLLKPNLLWPTYLLDIFYFTCYLICHHYLTRVKSLFINEITPLFHYLKHFFS
jgi:hypothetical protein